MKNGFIEQVDLELATLCNGETNKLFVEAARKATMELKPGQRATISIKVVLAKHPNSYTLMNVLSDLTLKMPSTANLSVVSIGENNRLLTDKIPEAIDQMALFEKRDKEKDVQKLTVVEGNIIDSNTGEVVGKEEN